MTNRNQIVDQLARELRFARADVDKIVEGFLAAITAKIKQGDSVNLAGFGQFYTLLRGARTGVNPRKPDEKIQIPAVRVPKFRAGKHLRQSAKE